MFIFEKNVLVLHVVNEIGKVHQINVAIRNDLDIVRFK